MRLIQNIIFTSCTAGLLAACSGTFNQAKIATPPADPFAQALHTGYLALARGERDENDFSDSEIFSVRALDAASGKPGAPEKLGTRRLPQESVPQIANARARLMTALDRDARLKSPVHAARAQLAFDCWVQEQEENIQPNDIAACRRNFFTALSQIETAPVAVAEPQRPQPMPAMLKGPTRTTPLTTRFVVYFDFDTARIEAKSENEITRAAQAARRTGAAMIRITGHADRAGPDGHNLALSRTRAQQVAQALRRLGLPEIGVATQAYGEEKPAVQTSDGVGEPRNRRVEIELTH